MISKYNFFNINMVENKYNLLNVEELDNSTNNLPRKYNKLIKSYKNRPSQEKLDKINSIEKILCPQDVIIKEKSFTRKKINSIIKSYVKCDNKLKKQLDERTFTSYILLSNVFPEEITKMIIKLCNFDDFIMDIPKDVYLFARIYYKNMEEKERMIELYKKNKQIKNLINNLHSKKYKK